MSERRERCPRGSIEIEGYKLNLVGDAGGKWTVEIIDRSRSQPNRTDGYVLPGYFCHHKSKLDALAAAILFLRQFDEGFAYDVVDAENPGAETDYAAISERVKVLDRGSYRVNLLHSAELRVFGPYRGGFGPDGIYTVMDDIQRRFGAISSGGGMSFLDNPAQIYDMDIRVPAARVAEFKQACALHGYAVVAPGADFQAAVRTATELAECAVTAH